MSLKSELSYDHTFIQFKGNHRSLDNFESISVITVDCDNDHSENEDNWYTVDDIHAKYSDVKHIIVTSRNHMKQKGNKTPRPRFHIIFWVGATLYSPKEYTKLITHIQSDLPIYDSNALDAARFFFANLDTEVFVHNGTCNLDSEIANALSELLRFAERSEMLTNFDESLFNSHVNKVIVYSQTEIGFELKCGLTLKERI